MLVCRPFSGGQLSVERERARQSAGAIIRRIVNQSERGPTDSARSKLAKGWQFAAFREWRSREHPCASYEIAPRVWRPEQLAQFAGYTDGERRMLKGSEPRLTGLAYSDRNVFLVGVVGELTAEHLGRLLYLVHLFRRDPDYAEHRGKHVRMVIIVREATATMIDFARRHRIRVMVLDVNTGADSAARPAGMNHAAQMNR
jgi:hypothetical protein